MMYWADPSDSPCLRPSYKSSYMANQTSGTNRFLNNDTTDSFPLSVELNDRFPALYASDSRTSARYQPLANPCKHRWDSSFHRAPWFQLLQEAVSLKSSKNCNGSSFNAKPDPENLGVFWCCSLQQQQQQVDLTFRCIRRRRVRGSNRICHDGSQQNYLLFSVLYL